MGEGYRRPHVRAMYAPTASEVAALERRYLRWANVHGLRETLAAHRRFGGRIGSRDLTFVTGLGGTAPLSPQLVVDVALDAKRSILVTGYEELETPVEHTLAELLPLHDHLRNVGITARFVRLTFEAGTEPERFDEALDGLEERLRLLDPAVGAYRGRAR